MKEVKTPKKPLIFYYAVAMLAVFLFNFFAMPWLAQHQIKEVDYNTFVEMVEQDKVGKVEIQEQDNRILFTDKDESVIYKTAMVSDDDLSARLLEAGVSFKGEEIEQTSLLVDILGWVLPILIFIALGQYMSKKMADKLGGGNSMMFGLGGNSNVKVYVQSTEGIHFADVAARDRTFERLADADVTITRCEVSSLEFTCPGVDKGTGLTALARQLGLGISQAIAVGDADNDLAMLRAAGLGVAMGNAIPAAVAAADVQVADNDHGGCAEAVRRYLLA